MEKKSSSMTSLQRRKQKVTLLSKAYHGIKSQQQQSANKDYKHQLSTAWCGGQADISDN